MVIRVSQLAQVCEFTREVSTPLPTFVTDLVTSLQAGQFAWTMGASTAIGAAAAGRSCNHSRECLPESAEAELAELNRVATAMRAP